MSTLHGPLRSLIFDSSSHEEKWRRKPWMLNPSGLLKLADASLSLRIWTPNPIFVRYSMFPGT